MTWKIVLVVLLSIFTIFILALFTNTIMLWDIYPEKVMGNIENWIGFYATIIGGLITFFGVLLTIQFNKKEIAKQNEKEKLKEEKNNSLNKIKFLWEIEVNLNGVVRDLETLNEYIVTKTKTINKHEYALLVNGRLNDEFFNKGLKPNKEQVEYILQEVGIQYVDKKFNAIKIQLQKFNFTYNERDLQVKSAEVDWETYEHIINITKQVYEICDTQKTITGPGSDEIVVFIAESDLIVKKISGMSGVIAQIEGIRHKINEKRVNIEKKYFSDNK